MTKRKIFFEKDRIRDHQTPPGQPYSGFQMYYSAVLLGYSPVFSCRRERDRTFYGKYGIGGVDLSMLGLRNLGRSGRWFICRKSDCSIEKGVMCPSYRLLYDWTWFPFIGPMAGIFPKSFSLIQTRCYQQSKMVSKWAPENSKYHPSMHRKGGYLFTLQFSAWRRVQLFASLLPDSIDP